MSATQAGPADYYIKDRLSLIELGFRLQQEEVERLIQDDLERAQNPRFKSNSILVPGDPLVGLKARENWRRSIFRSQVEELNARFEQAGYPLNYHNGFIQISSDALLKQQVETPFWSIVSGPMWKNVDLDMKEALDRRDNGSRDSAFFAARALESTIKIISDVKGWTQGGEKGASSYIDNLAAKSRAFIAPWEGTQMRGFFKDVRNPLGHGAGLETMPSLTRQQTEWAIEFCMIWIKSLISRL